MKLIRIVCLALLTSMLAACASGYQSRTGNMFRGVNGGYEEEQGPGQLIKISYTGTLGVTVHMAAHYVLYRSAEIAQREGKPYFALYQDLPAALKDRRSAASAFSTVGGKAYSYAYILPFDNDAPGLLAAEEVIARLAPKVKGRP